MKNATYWLKGERFVNFGDYLGCTLADFLFFDFDYYDANLHLTRSVLSDSFMPINHTSEIALSSEDDWDRASAVFWGCGIREPGSLLLKNLSNVRILSVRGPVSASDLRLGADIPIGDPALLLPALYTPRRIADFVGSSICIPHFNDERSDRELLELSGCDRVLRPRIAPTHEASLRFVDALTSADFVLSASLHATIVAAAYTRPFAIWQPGWLDLPTKWDDFAATVGVCPSTCANLKEGRQHYDANIAPNLRLPSMWPSLTVAPALIKPDALLKVLAHELRQYKPQETHDVLSGYIDAYSYQKEHFDRLAMRAADRAGGDKLAELEGQNLMLTSHLHRARADQENLVSQHHALAGELARLRDEHLSRSNDLAAAKQSASALTQQRDTVLAETQHLREAVLAGHTLAEHQALLDRHQILVAETAGLRDDQSLQSIRLSAAQASIASLEAERDSLQADLHLRDEAAVSQGRTQAQHQALVEEHKNATRELTELRQQLAAESKALAGTRLAVATSQKESSALRAEIDRLQSAADGHARSQTVLIEKISASEQAANAQAGKLNDVEERLSQMTAAFANADRWLAALGPSPREEVLRSTLLPYALKCVGRSSRRKDANDIASFLKKLDATATGLTNVSIDNASALYLAAGGSGHLDFFPLFDSSFYIEKYPDVAAAGIPPLLHYARHGFREHRWPHPLFDCDKYLDENREVESTGEGAVAHYLRWGRTKKRSPHWLFDADFYVGIYPDIASGMDPLVHYVMHGGTEGRWPHPLFDGETYLNSHGDIRWSKQNPLMHYLKAGAYQGYNPHRWFDSNFYLQRYPDVQHSGMNPLVHFVRYGATEGRQPHPDFDPAFYVAQVPDSGANPLLHFLTKGESAGKLPRAPKTVVSDAQTIRKSARPTALMIDAFYPKPDQDSGSLDQIHFVEIFQSLGFDVIFVADVEFGLETPYRAKLEEMGVTCPSFPQYRFVDEYLTANAAEIDLFFLSRVHFGGRHLEAIRSQAPQAKILFNTVDLHFIREERAAELDGSKDVSDRAKETRTRELALCEKADATIVVSHAEATLLANEAPGARVTTIPLIRHHPGTEVDFDDRAGIAFVGSFAHQPNVDALDFFRSDIWPRIRSRSPRLAFHVIGSGMPAEYKTRDEPGVHYVGQVDELSHWLDKVRLTVAPLRYGAGAKGKVISSLGHGVPCIATSIAAEGMKIPDNAISVADVPSYFADRVVEVYNDAERWSDLSHAGLAFVRTHHSVAAGRKIVGQLLTRIGGPALASAASERDAAE